ncbi:hypothetical protein TWF569_006162 [Orbilia oligospora]|uniref:Uncharacterized protein n=1 Tax=Orbilia oligospora TaxID=2813651 RepID=A0A7C8JF36_ORBOL|nr:hypothetical protein TWF706_001846 [Orbilia oligospora]KAF3110565.1 hypothetical protein TWF102_008140 [Orbilia oligospora]KAF3114836.1 hypothetical protein TWF103_000561 [Orbilia oligospora]KAF3147070.1 hypothetical protein TWF569_006162 [Orbilia oligospora]KAF3149064.1 hypothetical protein TWF594_000508 [Orbilia oligospora]
MIHVFGGNLKRPSSPYKLFKSVYRQFVCCFVVFSTALFYESYRMHQIVVEISLPSDNASRSEGLSGGMIQEEIPKVLAKGGSRLMKIFLLGRAPCYSPRAHG